MLRISQTIALIIISEVRGFIERMMASVSATAAVQAEAKLAAVAEIVARGKAEMAEMAADMNGKAFVSFEEALRMAQKA